MCCTCGHLVLHTCCHLQSLSLPDSCLSTMRFATASCAPQTCAHHGGPLSAMHTRVAHACVCGTHAIYTIIINPTCHARDTLPSCHPSPTSPLT